MSKRGIKSEEAAAKTADTAQAAAAESAEAAGAAAADRPLSPKQQLFVKEYLVDLNATGAYRRAGYRAKGSAATAGAAQILANPRVQAAVQEAFKARSERTEITADFVLRGLAAEATKGAHLDVPNAARIRALELLGKHLGMFPDRVRVGGDPQSPPVAFTEAEKAQATQNLMAMMAARNGTPPEDGVGLVMNGNGERVEMGAAPLTCPHPWATGPGPAAEEAPPDDGVDATEGAPPPLYPDGPAPPDGQGARQDTPPPPLWADDDARGCAWLEEISRQR
jgi:phage terminase small subunit